MNSWFRDVIWITSISIYKGCSSMVFTFTTWGIWRKKKQRGHWLLSFQLVKYHPSCMHFTIVKGVYKMLGIVYRESPIVSYLIHFEQEIKDRVMCRRSKYFLKHNIVNSSRRGFTKRCIICKHDNTHTVISFHCVYLVSSRTIPFFNFILLSFFCGDIKVIRKLRQ